MITLLRARDRQLDTSAPGALSQRHLNPSMAMRFGSLEYLDESRMAPGSRIIRRAAHGADVITYVREGSVAFDDNVGHRGTLDAGEFRRLTVSSNTRLVELNLSLSEDAQLFQIWLRPSEELDTLGCEQRRFTMAERRGLHCLVASPDGHAGSLRLRQDARVYSALLHRGQHVVHALTRKHRAWVHVVHGHVSVGGLVLTSGDAAGITHQLAASVTALDNSEILLVDVGPHPSQAIVAHHDDAIGVQAPSPAMTPDPHAKRGRR